MATNKKGSGNARSGRSTGASTNRTSSRKTGGAKANAPQDTLIGDLLLVGTFGLTVLLYLAAFHLCGKFGEWLRVLSFGLFGFLGYLTPALFLVIVCFLISNRKKRMMLIGKFSLIFGLVIATSGMLAVSAFSKAEFLSEQAWKNMYESSLAGRGGGVFGNGLALFLVPKCDKVASFIILLIVWIVLFLIVTDFSLIDWFEYKIRMYREGASAQKEIREIKQEERQIRRDAKFEQRQKHNEELMMKAREELAKSRMQQAKEVQEASERRKMQDEGGRKDRIVPTFEEKPELVLERPQGAREDMENPLKPLKKTARRKIVRDSEQERRRIPTFLLKQEDEEEKVATPPMDVEKESYTAEVPNISNVHQMHISEIKPEPPKSTIKKPSFLEKKPEEEKKPVSGMTLTRKPFEPVKEEEDRVIEMAGGRVINARVGMGGTQDVEAEGTELHPHGTSTTYTDDEPVIPTVSPTAPTGKEKKYKFPPLTLLTKPMGSVQSNRSELKEMAQRFQDILDNFNIAATVSDVTCGPSVTRYEVTPDMGVRVASILTHQDDIKLHLAATDMRIEAPIPGKAAVGFEVPNKKKTAVTLREMLVDDEFRNHPSKLAFAVGKDIDGSNVFGDMSKMPHLLISGTTGSGKSVCLNSILLSMLYHASPSEVKMILIDPKKVELKPYNGIPHLLRPVINDPKQGANALSWAVMEMNRRYALFGEHNVRDLSGYNDLVREKAAEEGNEHPPILPQILIVVEELADLMLSAKNEVEDSIQHLAQMARAAGMHMILVAQRPSVDVVTGVIKANVPSRIALKVASQADSRTMLDGSGAEKLSGNGDMLYYPSGANKPTRLQGPFISDKEVNEITEFIRNQANVEGGGYQELSVPEVKATPGNAEEDDRDEYMVEAGEFIIANERATIGVLQRKFKIGFNRAARIMDQLAEEGVVGPEEGTKPRNILMSLEEFRAKFK